MQACILPSTHLCEAIQHVLPGDAHVVQFEEAMIHVFKVHLGPNVPNGDPYEETEVGWPSVQGLHVR